MSTKCKNPISHTVRFLSSGKAKITWLQYVNHFRLQVKVKGAIRFCHQSSFHNTTTRSRFANTYKLTSQMLNKNCNTDTDKHIWGPLNKYNSLSSKKERHNHLVLIKHQKIFTKICFALICWTMSTYTVLSNSSSTLKLSRESYCVLLFYLPPPPLFCEMVWQMTCHLVESYLYWLHKTNTQIYNTLERGLIVGPCLAEEKKILPGWIH